MSNLSSYPIRSFSETQQFLVNDPATGTASRVRASDLVAYITPRLNSVIAETTRLAAENTNYAVGEIIQTSGATSPGDNFAAVYLVVAAGEGDFPMINGNELLVIRGDEFLREQLISEDAGEGASLVSMEGGPTVEVAVNNRVIRVSSRTEMKAYDVPVDYQFSLEEGGRSGLFVRRAGSPPITDTYEGVYVVADAGGYDERINKNVITPEMYGASGNGTDDDANRLVAALTFASENGYKFVGGGNSKTYRLGSTARLNRAGHGPFEMDWNGSTLFCDDFGLVIEGDEEFLTTGLTSDVARGATTFIIDDATGVEKGDLIGIVSPALSVNGVDTNHYYVVGDIDGTTIYPDGFVVADITTAQITDSGQTGSIVVKAYKMAKGLEFKNLTLNVTDTLGDLIGVNIKQQDQYCVSGIRYTGPSRFGVYTQFCGYGSIKDAWFFDYGYVSENQGFSNDPSSPDGLSFGYGIEVARCYNTTIENCHGGRGWHLTDISRGAMFTQHIGCTTNKDGYGFATHENSWYVLYDGCNAYGGFGYNVGRSAYVTIKGGEIMPNLGQAVSPVGCTEFTMSDVDVFMSETLPASATSIFSQGGPEHEAGELSVDYPFIWNVSNCRLHGVQIVSGPLGYSSSALDKMVLTFKDNTFTSTVPARGGRAELPACKTVSVSNNTFNSVLGQWPLKITGDVIGYNISVSGTRVLGDFETVAGSAIVFMDGTGDGTENIEFIDNGCLLAQPSAVCRVSGGAMDIKFMLRNWGTLYILRGDASSLGVNGIGNQYYTGEVFGGVPAFTKSEFNSVLS